jgi:hypothetical protein
MLNEEHHNLYASPTNKSRRMRWAVHVVCVRETRSAYKILVTKLEGKRPLGESRCRLENNIRMNHRETGWEGFYWMHLAQDRGSGRLL